MKDIKNTCTVKQDGLSCHVHIEVDSQEVKRLLEKKYNDYRHKAKVKGYRMGKVPMPVILQLYGPSLRMQLTEEMMQALEKQVMQSHALEPIDEPKRDCEVVEAEKHFTLDLEFETYPDIPEYHLETLKIAFVEPKQSDDDIKKALHDLKTDTIHWKEVDRASQTGDCITAFFAEGIVGEKEDKKLDKVDIILTDDLPEEVKKTLLGIKATDHINVENIHSEAWASVIPSWSGLQGNVGYLQNIKVLEKDEIAFDKAFWKMKGYDAEDEGSLEQMLSKEIDMLAASYAEDINYETFRPILVGLVDFPLPDNMVKKELDRLKTHENSEGVDVDQLARDNVKLSLLLRDRLQKKNISLDNERLIRYIKSKSPVEGQMRDYYVQLVSKNQDMMRMSAMAVIEHQLLDDLLQDVQKEVTHVSFSELQSMENA